MTASVATADVTTAWLGLMDTPFSLRFVDAGGVRTRVIEAGEGEPLVLLHGTGGHAEAYLRNLEAVGADFRLVVVDMLGHGFTDKPDRPYTPPEYTAHLIATLDALGIEQTHISGESLGAWVAAWTAREHPDRVRRLVLNTPGNVNNDPKVMAMIRDSSRRAVAEASTESVRARLSWLFAEANRHLITDELVAMRLRIYSQPGFDRAMERILALQDPEVRARFAWEEAWVSEIPHRTLVLWTSDDPTGTEAEGRLLAGWLPDGRMHFMDGAGHWPQWERPEEFAALHRGFLLGA